MVELFRIFIDILVPVFALVGLGAWMAGSLPLDAQTLSKLAYWVLGPAFVFDVLAGTDLDTSVVIRVVAASVLTMLGAGAVAWAGSRLRGSDRSVTGASVLTSVHGNVGNFGLAICAFAFGPEALPIAGIVLVTVNTLGILVGVGIAAARTSTIGVAVRRAFLAPMALAVIPAVVVNALGRPLPVAVDRPVGLLAAAMIPMMLLTLGIQLRLMRDPVIGRVVVLPLAAKLLLAPLVASAAVVILGLRDLPAAVVIVQAAMPAAVFTSLVALEHDLEPDLVTTIVLSGTLVSVATLPAVLAIVS